MAVLVGIDEAGYGPTLGPLVVSAVVLRVADDRLHTCLWKLLAESCTRKVSASKRRLPIADSKRLYRSGDGVAGLELLERSALVMLAAAGHRVTTSSELLRLVAPHVLSETSRYPWYAGADLALPVSPDVGGLATRGNAVRRNLANQAVCFAHVFCEPLLEGDFNELVRKTQNKANVLLSLVHRLLDRVLHSSPDANVRICVDRLGGRIQYREMLTAAFDGHDLRIDEESDIRSAYRLVNSTRRYEVEFVTNGETFHFPIALASIYSKYLREVYMRRFNDFWLSRQSNLRPTAGYHSDAKRWLREAKPLLDRLGVDRNLLVRDR